MNGIGSGVPIYDPSDKEGDWKNTRRTIKPLRKIPDKQITVLYRVSSVYGGSRLSRGVR